MRFPDAPASLKLACGENPKRVHGQERKSKPQSRMGEVAMLRQELARARAYQPERGKAPEHGREALAAALRGEILIQNHCYRADEMLLRLELFGEFDARPRAFHHAVEAYKIAPQLAQAQVGAVVWADWWGTKLELWDAVPAGAALLHAAGVRVALHSDSPVDIQYLNQEAAKALAAGRRAGLELDRDDAIRWITANPAWILGIDQRVGTLEPDRDADLVLWSGDPLSVYARAERVWIAGVTVWERGRDAEPRSDFELGLRGAP
jgi:imidazolonepropionase-like amidohydrolase